MSLESKITAIENAIAKAEHNIQIYKSCIVSENENIKEYKKTLKKLEKIKISVDSIFEEAGITEEDQPYEDYEDCETCNPNCDCDSGACM